MMLMTVRFFRSRLSVPIGPVASTLRDQCVCAAAVSATRLWARVRMTCVVACDVRSPQYAD